MNCFILPRIKIILVDYNLCPEKLSFPLFSYLNNAVDEIIDNYKELIHLKVCICLLSIDNGIHLVMCQATQQVANIPSRLDPGV
jgi:hypothetical protein